ncbi:MAG TPA: anti-sigma factor antagonist [Clostridia bacterium]|nr:MAG: Anti-sigma F factor antagonist [Firmicutes bacterium ADurb.Bin356]HOF94252.1 anti-sigma factor antagonist [Clostridia bacterium]HOR13420.1 anti-sigma factor antagonist [Clostridia bacterium]
MQINATRKGQRIKAMLAGELDHHSAQYVREVLDSLIADPQIRELVLDMSNVEFMDSSGLGVILGRYRTLSARGGRLLLAGVPAPIDRIFRISGIYALVERA